MKFFLYALALTENTITGQHCAVFEGDEPPTELTNRQRAAAYLGQIMPKHRHEVAEKLAALDDNQLVDYFCSEMPTFTHGVWIAEALQPRLDFMAGELDDSNTCDHDLYSFGQLWANTLKKYAYRGMAIPFPELAVD